MTGSNLRRYTTLPLSLSADRDDDLVRVTEHRVGTFSHDLVPHYLRTKPEPEGKTRFEMKLCGHNFYLIKIFFLTFK